MDSRLIRSMKKTIMPGHKLNYARYVTLRNITGHSRSIFYKLDQDKVQN